MQQDFYFSVIKRQLSHLNINTSSISYNTEVILTFPCYLKKKSFLELVSVKQGPNKVYTLHVLVASSGLSQSLTVSRPVPSSFFNALYVLRSWIICLQDV